MFWKFGSYWISRPLVFPCREPKNGARWTGRVSVELICVPTARGSPALTLRELIGAFLIPVSAAFFYNIRQEELVFCVQEYETEGVLGAV